MGAAEIVILISTAVAAVAKAVMEGLANAGVTQAQLDAGKAAALSALTALDTQVISQVAREWRIAHGLEK